MLDEINIRIRTEAGGLWATVEEFPGVFATGKSPAELCSSLEEGISLYLAPPGRRAPTVRLDGFEVGSALATARLVRA